MVSYLSRFEDALGDVDSWVYKDLIRRNNLIVSSKFNSPVRKVAGRIVADCKGLADHWSVTEPFNGYLNTSSIVRNLGDGNLSEVLKELDKLVSLLAALEVDNPTPLPTSKRRVLEKYENNFSQLLKLLSVLTRNETPLLTEELLAIVSLRYAFMTPIQVASLKKARKLGDKLWIAEENYKDLGKFIDLLEPLIQKVYPAESSSWSALKTDEVYRLLEQLKKVHEDMEVLELWNTLTVG